MIWIKKAVLWSCVVATLLATAALATPASAQDANIRSVTFYTVKPDRLGDFQAEVKEYNAILAKAGSDRYSTIWVALTGNHEYARVQMYKKWADLDSSVDSDPKLKDQATDLARIATHIIECTSSWRRNVDVIMPDYSVPDNGDVPKMIRVLITHVRPEKFREYLDFQKNVVLPAIQKSGATTYNFADKRFGQPGPVYVSVLGINSWADLDNGIGGEKGTSKDEYKALVDHAHELIVSSDFIIYRYDPDLSYLPAPTPAPAAK